MYDILYRKKGLTHAKVLESSLALLSNGFL